jgi:hypothetical protein
MTNMLMEEEKLFLITELQVCCLLPNDFLVFLLLTILNISHLSCTQCVHTCACVCILTHKGKHMHIHASTCTWMCTHVLAHVRTCPGRQAGMHTRGCAHAHTHTHTHTRARTHTHTHTHTHTKAMCLSNGHSLKYTWTTPQPPATSNLLILRPTTNFISLLTPGCDILYYMLSAPPFLQSQPTHTTEKANCWPTIILLWYPTQATTIDSNWYKLIQINNNQYSNQLLLILINTNWSRI